MQKKSGIVRRVLKAIIFSDRRPDIEHESASDIRVSITDDEHRRVDARMSPTGLIDVGVYEVGTGKCFYRGTMWPGRNDMHDRTPLPESEVIRDVKIIDQLNVGDVFCNDQGDLFILIEKPAGSTLCYGRGLDGEVYGFYPTERIIQWADAKTVALYYLHTHRGMKWM